MLAVKQSLGRVPYIVALIDAAEGEPKKRGSYKARQPAEISN
jgi:hypothetical protein